MGEVHRRVHVGPERAARCCFRTIRPFELLTMDQIDAYILDGWIRRGEHFAIWIAEFGVFLEFNRYADSAGENQ